MKKVLVFILAIIIASCSNYGEKITIDGTEVFYKDGVTKEQAQQLADYLKQEGFTDGTAKSVQFVKNEKTNTLTFRMVMDSSSINDESNMVLFESTARNLSKEFGQPIDFEACDVNFKTIKTVQADDVPKLVEIGNTQVLYTKNITEKEATDLAKFITGTDESKNATMTVKLDRQSDTVLFMVVVKDGYQNDESYLKILKIYGQLITKEVFSDKPLKVQVCNTDLKVLKTLE